jgi:hypothetical protein
VKELDLDTGNYIEVSLNLNDLMIHLDVAWTMPNNFIFLLQDL